MIRIVSENATHTSAREVLLDATLGLFRYQKCSQRLRDFRKPADGLAFAALKEDRLVGTVRLWNVQAGDCPALLLGPLATDPCLQGQGIGSALMRQALGKAANLGHQAVILVGDYRFYERFGFSPERTQGLSMPGPYDPSRFLGLELVAGALHGASGIVKPAGQFLHSAVESRESLAFPSLNTLAA